MIHAAFDGGSSNEGSGSGFIIEGYAVGFTYNGDTTNSHAELTALLKLLEVSKDFPELTVLGDSNYIIQGVNNWMYKWKKNNWEKSDGSDIAHWELWDAIYGLASVLPRTFKHVRGHQGNELNEIADELTWLARYTKSSNFIYLDDKGKIELLKLISISPYKSFPYLTKLCKQDY